MRFISLLCHGWVVEPSKAHHEYSISPTHYFQSQAMLPVFQQKLNHEVHESQPSTELIGQLTKHLDLHGQF